MPKRKAEYIKLIEVISVIGVNWVPMHQNLIQFNACNYQ